MKAAQPTPLAVYDFPPSEAAYWDALDNRVTCDGCRNRDDNFCRAGKRRTIEPPQLKHRCPDFKRARQ